MNQQELRHRMMTTTPVPKLIGRLAVPSIISMLVSALYNMADAMFVGRLSTEATAAVGIIFSYMTLVQATGFFFGQGSANYMSRALGAKNVDGAKQMAAVGFFSAFFIGTAFMIGGLSFMQPILHLFGATPSLMADSQAYFFFILLATPFAATSFVLNNQMRLQGNAKLGMMGIATGAVLNIVLDPLFIFGMNMGIMGASLATCISQVTSFTILVMMTRRKDTISVRWKYFRPTKELYRQLAGGGMPSLGRQGLQSVATIVLNNCAGLYGDAAIAAFAVVNRIINFGGSVIIGIGQGFQPVCGFNYGAKAYDRVREAFFFTMKVMTIYAGCFAAAAWIFAPQIVGCFRPDDPAVQSIGVEALRNLCLIFPLFGVTTMVGMLLQNICRTVPATLLAAARQGIFLIPAVLVGTAAAGLDGLVWAQPVADVLTFGLSIPFGISELSRIAAKHRRQLAIAPKMVPTVDQA